jgi:hypothetical protein
MPPAELVTVPDPVPSLALVRAKVGSNLAVAARAPVIVSVQVLVPEQSPDQPAKDEPGAAVAVRVTDVPDV